MRNSDFVFETILIVITILVLLWSFYGDGGSAIAIWWAILGLLQVSHAIIMISTNPKRAKIVEHLKRYFLGVVLSFVLLGIYQLVKFRITIWDSLIVKIVIIMSIIILPAMLVLYLWFITWHFRRSSEVEKTG